VEPGKGILQRELGLTEEQAYLILQRQEPTKEQVYEGNCPGRSSWAKKLSGVPSPISFGSRVSAQYIKSGVLACAKLGPGELQFNTVLSRRRCDCQSEATK
jgi:hypothetical protein